MGTELMGQLHTWGFGQNKRRYFLATMTFGDARQLFRAEVFDALRNQGEQRSAIESHVAKLRRAMEKNNFTPVPVSVGLRPKHKEALKIKGDEALLKVPTDEFLPLTDGGHRFRALETMREVAAIGVKRGKNDEEVGRLKALIAEIDSQPITAVVHVDGETQDDFVNLQLGRNVDATHLLSLRIRRKKTTGKDAAALEAAFQVASRLQKDPASPFHRYIRFDTRGGEGRIPLNTLCATGGSNMATSLVGLARVALAAEPAKTADWMGNTVIACTDVFKQQAPQLVVDEGTNLTIPPGHTRGSVTMLVGVSTCMAYRLTESDRDEMNKQDKARLVKAAEAALGEPPSGGLPGPAKRMLMGRFATEFFGDFDEEKYEGVPVGLLHTLSVHAFGLPPMEKEAEPEEEDEVA